MEGVLTAKLIKVVHIFSYFIQITDRFSTCRQNFQMRQTIQDILKEVS